MLEEKNKLMHLAERAEGGDALALAELKKLSNERIGVWLISAGDIAAHAEETLLKVAAGENLLLREGIKRKLEALKQELAGPSASPLERLLIERIVACWLQMYYADAVFAQNISKVPSKHQEYFQRRQDRAHHRFLTAVKALAQIRRLDIPALQINLGEKQVNFANR